MFPTLICITLSIYNYTMFSATHTAKKRNSFRTFFGVQRNQGWTILTLIKDINIEKLAKAFAGFALACSLLILPRFGSTALKLCALIETFTAPIHSIFKLMQFCST